MIALNLSLIWDSKVAPLVPAPSTIWLDVLDELSVLD